MELLTWIKWAISYVYDCMLSVYYLGSCWVRIYSCRIQGLYRWYYERFWELDSNRKRIVEGKKRRNFHWSSHRPSRSRVGLSFSSIRPSFTHINDCSPTWIQGTYHQLPSSATWDQVRVHAILWFRLARLLLDLSQNHAPHRAPK